MKKEEMMEVSKKKIDRVKALMEELKLSVEPRMTLDKNNFVIDVVVWVDTEMYPPDRMPEPPEHA